MNRLTHIIRQGVLALLLGLQPAIAEGQAPPRAARPASPLPAASTGHPLVRSDVDAWLDGYMPYALRTADVAGGVVVVVKDGAVLTARGYGFADPANRSPVDPARTLFRVGSISKLFTWTAVMQQVEAGKLDLDRDVNSYLDFRIPAYGGRPITLRQLMTHTAGFELAEKDTITFGAPISLDGFLKRWTPARIYPPGTTPAYSNWGAALAGYIVQRVSGRPYAEYIEERILAPLGMQDATFVQPLPTAFAPFMSRGYLRASDGARPFETIGPAPAGALSASGTDIAKFMIAHLEGGAGLMSPRTAAMMHDSPLDKVDARSLVPPLNRMELGFIQMNLNGHQIIGHGGDTQQFHSLLALFPDDGAGLFVSLNSAGRDGAGGTLRNQLLEDFADRYFPGAPDRARVAGDVARRDAQLMSGTWLGSGHAEHGFLALAVLAAQVKIGVASNGSLSIPSLKDAGGAPLQWDEVAPFVWRSRSGHERLAAVVAHGRVVRWGTDSAPIQVFERVPASWSAAWIVPALGISLIILLLTALHWPASWIIRRRYRAPLKFEGRALLAYRALRAASFLELIVLGAWLTLLSVMLSNLDWLGRRSDGWLRLLEVAGLILFVAAVPVSAWNALLTWRDGRGWGRRLWSVAVLLATLVILYVAWTFGLLNQTTNY